METNLRNKALLAAALVPLLATSASAHVALAKPFATAGTRHVAQFQVGHGCGKSPTVSLRIEMPGAVSNVDPQDLAGWSIATVRSGTRTNAVIFKDGNLPADRTRTFSVAMTLPSHPATLAFPVIQTCADGKIEWTQIAAAGAKPAHPAPVLTVRGASDVQANAAGLRVTDAWIRLLPAGLPAAGYFTLTNDTARNVTLVSAAAPGCGMLMLHLSEKKGGMTTMRHVSEIAMPAGQSVRFSPGGYHLMCMDVAPSLKPGGRMAVTFSFRDGARLQADFSLRNAAGK